MRRSIPFVLFAGVSLGISWKFLILGRTFYDVRTYESYLGRPRRERPGWFESHRPPVDRGDTVLLLPIHDRIYNEGLKNGELRLWNPYLFCGYPVTFDPMTRPFYPPNLALHAIFGPSAAHGIGLVLHLFFSGAAMFWALRGLGRSAPASAVGGVVWMLGGYNALWFTTGVLAGACVWAPLAMLGFAGAMENGGLRRAALGGAALGMAILGSHPQHALHLCVFFSAWSAAAAARRPRDAGRAAVALAVFALFAAGTGFVAILSHVDTIANCFRAAGCDVDLIYGRPWRTAAHLAGLFLGKIWMPSDPLVRSELTVYVGLGGAALAAAGACRRFGDPPVRFLALFAAAALLAAFIRPLAELLLCVPVLNMSMPSRWVFVAGMCLAALAAYGFDALAEDAGRAPHVLAAAAGLLAGACVIGAGPFRISNGVAIETIIGATLAAAAAGAAGRRTRVWTCGILAAIMVDLLPGFVAFNGTADPAPLFETPEAVRFAKGLDPGPWRALGGLRDPAAGPAPYNGWTAAVGNNLLALHGVEAAGGYEAAAQAVYAAYWDMAGGGVFGSGRALAMGNLDSRLLDVAGVKYLFMPFAIEPGSKYRKIGEWGPLRLYENAAALPRALVVRGVVPARDPSEAAALIRDPGFNPALSAVLEGAGDMASPPGRVGHRVEWVERRSDRIRLEVEAEEAGVLVLSETHHPGWRAEVDGREARVFRADLAFRAVAVPAGRHSVTFRFRPEWLGPGLAVSAAFALFAAFLAAFLR